MHDLIGILSTLQSMPMQIVFAASALTVLNYLVLTAPAELSVSYILMVITRLISGSWQGFF